jgi:two-component system KDP operon response regulator KdpE
MNKPRILLVEDETDIRRFIKISLEKEGMNIYEAASAEQARIDAASRKPDLIIVDLGLPDADGKTLIRELRAWSSAPVVVLSAREQESEKVEALDAGADDYLTKPFGVPELLARVRAQLRRATLVFSNGAESATVQFGNICVDLGTHEVTNAGEIVHLTPIEFRLLTALIRGHGKVLTHRQLLLDVWGPGYVERSHYIRIYMANLRQKLEDDPTRPQYLITELQVGYRLAGLETKIFPKCIET